MDRVISRDGTPIACDRQGQGPPVILVDGALCSRAFGPSRKLAAGLTANFTVYTYDRRGRGDSGDTPPYAVEREIEDLGAIISAAGGTACVYGISSGAALALEAANAGLPISKLALYEAPFIVDNGREPIPDDFLARLNAAVSSDRRGDAVRLFMQLVGAPGIMVFLMRFMPMWPRLKAVAHTLPYDISIVQDNQRGKPLLAGRWRGATMPTMVLDGGKSPAWIRRSARALADALPAATLTTLPGQTHMVRPDVLAPVLIDFFRT